MDPEITVVEPASWPNAERDVWLEQGDGLVPLVDEGQSAP